MTRNEIIAIVQGGLDDGSIQSATIDGVELKKTPPPPAPDLADLTRYAFRTSDKQLTLRYAHPGGTTRLWANGKPTTTRDGDGQVFTTHTAQTRYQVYTDATPPENGVPVSKTLDVRADGSVGAAPVPDPGDTDPGPIVTDPTIPDTAQLVTVDEFNAKQQPGKAYIIKPGEYTFGDESGIVRKANGTSIYAVPGKVLIRSTGTLEFARCVDCYGDDVTIFGLNFAGPGKNIGIQFNDVRRANVLQCGAPNGDIGTFIECKGATDLLWRDCTLEDFRRYVFYGKLAGVSRITNVKWGRSLGGTYKGKTFNQEHGIRVEDNTGDLTITDCAGKIGSVSGDKSDLQIKRRKVTVIGGVFYNVGLGPTGDGDGLAHKSDPAYVLRGAMFDGVTIKRELRLELNFLDGLFRKCNIERVTGDDSGQYRGEYLAAGRKLPSATFEQGNVVDVGGVTSGFKFQ